MAKQIPLSQGLFATVDDEDYEELTKRKWYAHYSPSNRKFYAISNVPNPAAGKTPDGKTKRSTIRMHRVVMGVEGIALVGKRHTPVDHKDGNTLNNQKDNLRIADCTLNNANRGPTKNNKSGFKGVHWTGCRWRATIQSRGQGVHLGCFRTKEEAHAAYMRAAVEHFGEFANAG